MKPRPGGSIDQLITRRALLALPLLGVGAGCRPVTPLAAQAETKLPETSLLHSEPRTTLTFGGDVMLSRYVGKLARMKNDPAWPFRAIAPLFAAADIAFVNLESPFCPTRSADAGMVFKAQASMMEGLMLAGIDVVSTANNHARDCGPAGIEGTLDLLRKNGIAAAGTATSEARLREGVVLERNGIKFGFLGYTYDQRNGNYPQDDERIAGMNIGRMQEDVSGMLTRGAGAVIVSMHAGDEYQPRPNRQQKMFARAAIEAGASLVIGHHPHVVQPSEAYQGGVIFYSLGNLIFDQDLPGTRRGLIVNAVFSAAKLDSVSALTVKIENTAAKL
ncbi:MAG TPA: CapA family protein [Bryobacteraceae bacterium]|nr:CapA family protein [Bryobacteraceae bacterium]